MQRDTWGSQGSAWYREILHILTADGYEQPNILVDESGNPRIADFGFATIARNPNSRRSTLNGDGNTARWSAPELLMNGQPATKESDIFSFGMVMVEVGSDKFTPAPLPSHYLRRYSPEKLRTVNAGPRRL